MTPRQHRRKRPDTSLISARGFTLIELMVVLAIVVILGTLAAPAMSTLIEQNRVATQINSFIGDLQWARGEAVKRGIPVIVCTSSNGATCVTNNKWELGWIAFVDSDADGILDTSEAIIKKRGAFKAGDSFKIVKPATSPPNTINFTRDGFAVSASQLSFELKATAGTTRCLELGTTGRMNAKAGACP